MSEDVVVKNAQVQPGFPRCYTVLYTLIHLSVHLFAYALPRAVWTVCVRWPLRALSYLLGIRLSTCDGRDERHVRVLGPVGSIGSSPTATARERFGISEKDLANPSLHHDEKARAAEGDAVAPSWLQYAGPLYNGHVHTILGAFRPPLPLRSPERQIVPSYDGNPTCLDWWLPTPAEQAAAAAACATKEGIRVRALVVILPGLTGSSKEFYVRRMARQLLASNMAVCVLNARGVADTPLEKPQIFSALFTKDVRHVMANYLTRQQVEQRLLRDLPVTEQPDTSKPLPILGVAFSLGGLILSNYVSEQGAAGAESGFDAVYTVNSPHNVSDGAAAMRSPVTHAVYGASFYGGLRSYYEHHKDVIEKLPGLNTKALFTGAKPLIDQLRTVQDFDEYITGPHFGFPGAEAYYSHANNFRRLHLSRTPQVCVVAANDPICGSPQPDPLWVGVIDRHRGGLVCVEMPVGGHLGFLSCPWREWLQAPNELESFIVYSMTHFVDSAGCESASATTEHHQQQEQQQQTTSNGRQSNGHANHKKRRSR